jgi:hypothetical protein
MKKSQLIKIIKEEITKVISEQSIYDYSKKVEISFFKKWSRSPSSKEKVLKVLSGYSDVIDPANTRHNENKIAYIMRLIEEYISQPDDEQTGWINTHLQDTNDLRDALLATGLDKFDPSGAEREGRALVDDVVLTVINNAFNPDLVTELKRRKVNAEKINRKLQAADLRARIARSLAATAKKNARERSQEKYAQQQSSATPDDRAGNPTNRADVKMGAL